MAKSELVASLIQAHYAGDAVLFSKAVTQMVQDEEKKKNYAVAESYRAALRTRPTNDSMASPSSFAAAIVARQDYADVLQVVETGAGLDAVVLGRDTLEEVHALVREWKSRHVLAKHHLRPRNRVLFDGPPGCGKTATAKALAGELGLPLALVRFDSLISSYLGQTGSNIKRVFDYAAATPCVLLVDELDAIGKMRNDTSELGELKRVVITLLQNLDALTGDSLIVAATNHGELLDDALWRRFNVVCKFALPSRNERVQIIHKKVSEFTNLGINEYDILGDVTEGFSGSDLAEIVESSWRKCVLDANPRNLPAVMIEVGAKFAASRGLLSTDTAVVWASLLRSHSPRRYSFSVLENLLGVPHSTLHNRLVKGKA